MSTLDLSDVSECIKCGKWMKGHVCDECGHCKLREQSTAEMERDIWAKYLRD